MFLSRINTILKTFFPREICKRTVISHKCIETKNPIRLPEDKWSGIYPGIYHPFERSVNKNLINSNKIPTYLPRFDFYK